MAKTALQDGSVWTWMAVGALAWSTSTWAVADAPKSVESIGACMAARLGTEAAGAFATGRANVYISGRNRLVLSLAYNTIMEEIPMTYHLELQGGFKDPGRPVEGIDLYFEMKRLSDEEVRGVLLRGQQGDREIFDMAFPGGIPPVWVGSSFDQGLADLLIFYYGEIDRFTRPLGRLLGAMAYPLDAPVSGDQETARSFEFRTHADLIGGPGAVPKFEVFRKDGRGPRVDLASCL